MPDTTTPAYFETLIMGDGPDGRLDCYFACNLCDRRLDDGPCPQHAPLNVPGLQLADCTAEPRHARTWVLDGDTYGAPCMYCAYDAMNERVKYLERCRHRGWRRTRPFKWLAGCAYSLGIVIGYGISHGGGEYGHNGCAHGFRLLGKRSYILGWPTWKWSCLLRKHHWPATFVGLDSCSKCLPCPDCGSTTSCFSGCENAGASA